MSEDVIRKGAYTASIGKKPESGLKPQSVMIKNGMFWLPANVNSLQDLIDLCKEVQDVTREVVNNGKG